MPVRNQKHLENQRKSEIKTEINKFEEVIEKKDLEKSKWKINRKIYIILLMVQI